VAGPIRVLGIAGSLRVKSFNRGLLRAAAELAPPGVAVTIADLAPIPLYNEDVRTAGEPAAVTELKRRIAECDALLIATAEYNYSLPGVLKNTFDWVSRPPATSPFRGKPAAIMGASTGAFGTVRAQMALRLLLSAVGCFAMPRPELMVSMSHEHFDADSNLVDAERRESVRKVLEALVTWTAHFAPR
jgi:chromate reductase